MSRPLALLGSLAFLALAPGTVVVLVPFWLTGWRMGPPLLGTGVTRVAGAALCAAGAAVLLDSFARFALRGRGTPAPVLPTRHLVVSGLYRFVLGYEEPTLRRTFGAEYDAFRSHVPRWIPRARPWRGSAAGR